MHEREKMQAHFSKNNNFGETLRTDRNIFTLALFSQLFYNNATSLSSKYFFFSFTAFPFDECNLQHTTTVHFIPPVLYRSETIPHFELNILTAHRGKHLHMHVFDRKVSCLIP